MTIAKEVLFLISILSSIWDFEAFAARTGPFTATEANVSTSEDSPVSVTLSVTSSRGWRQQPTYNYAIETEPLYGNVTQSASGASDSSTITYTPSANFYGEDSFTYSATDGRGRKSVANVEVTVQSVNDAPSISAGPVSVGEDGEATGATTSSDADGDTLAFSYSDPEHGVVTSISDGSYVYAPDGDYNGSDSFTVTATDPSGATATATVNVTVESAAELWNFSSLGLENGALISSAGSVLTVTLPSDETHDVNGGPAIVGPDPSGDNWAVYAGSSFFAVNLRTGEARVIAEDLKSGATPLAINNDGFQGFVLTMTSAKRGDNGTSGTLMISDLSSGMPVNNVYNPAGNIAIDTSAALLSESDSGEFEFVVGSTNTPDLYERVIDTINAGSLFRMNQNGEIVAILNENSDTPIHNWMGSSPTVDDRDSGAIVIEGTSVGHDGSGTDWNTAGIPCSLITFDPYTVDESGNMALLSVYDPGQAGCSTAIYESSVQPALDSAMVPEIVPGVSGENATYWGRLYGDPDESDGKDTGIAFQVYRDDPSAVKCTAEWDNAYGNSSMVGFYNGIVTDDAGNAYLTLKRTVTSGSRTVKRTSLARLGADDCAITYLYDFSSYEAGTPGLGISATGQSAVMVTGDDGYLLIFDPESGSELARHQLGSAEVAIASPVVTADGVVVIQKDNTLNVVDAGIVASWGIWPRSRGDDHGTGRMRFE